MIRIATSGGCRLRACLVAVALALVMAGTEVAAQAHAGDDQATSPPLLAASFQRLDEALALGLLANDNAATRWVAGRLATLQPAQQTRDLGAAWSREPADMLYIASLADACMRPLSPIPDECRNRDPLGFWSSRDPRNAVPWLLQAERSRRRNNVGSLVENLEGAARSASYEDYSGRGGVVFASVVQPLATEADRAAALLYADQHGAAPLASPLAALEAVCAPSTRQLDERIARLCVRLGGLMAERATHLLNRRAGAQIAQSVAATDSARVAASAAARAIVEQQDRCRQAVGALERLAAGAATGRNRAQSLGQGYLTERAKSGQAAACDALHRALFPGSG